MTAKLHIDMSQGIVDVEGDVEFVRDVYNDFKGLLLSGGFDAQPTKDAAKKAEVPKSKKSSTKRKAPTKKRTNGDKDSGGVNPDAPVLDKNLNTAGLKEFYGQYEPKNNSEKILIFLKFMIEKLGIDAPNTDQFYTCFDEVGEPIPTAFRQAFITASGRRAGYIDFDPSEGVSITIKGSNHFNSGLKKKGDE